MKTSIKLITMLLFCNIFFFAKAAETPRPEYPRPQFERTDWVNLNGEWSYTFDFSQSGLERSLFKSEGFDDNIIVPFCPESKLSGVGYKDFINNIWYHRKIEIPQTWDGKNIRLNFGAVYYTAEVYIDGKFVLRHFGGSTSFSADITKFVKSGQTHNLVVYAKSDLRSATQAAGKQSLRVNSYGCNYTRTTGIWQTVWMEPVAVTGLKSTQVITDIDQSQVVIHPAFYRESGNTLKVSILDNGKVVGKSNVKATNNSIVIIPIKKAKLWSPANPFLYDVVYEIINKEGKVVDKVNSYLGMRKVHTEGNKIYLNNKPFYQRLVLDQGFYPDGIWTAPTDADLKKDIELSMAAGFNGARLHQKVFEERFYYYADKLGYITWGEAASWGMDCNAVETARNFLGEWEDIIVRDRNHPSILIWTPLNEAWWPDQVQYPRFAADLYEISKNLDPTRPVNTSSGGVHILTDIYSVHDYEQNGERLKKNLYNDKGEYKQTTPNGNTNRGKSMNIGFNGLAQVNQFDFYRYPGDIPYLIDEFGGIKWTIEQQKNPGDSWGYGNAPKTKEEFYSRLEGQVDAIISLKDQVWGYCYTQLTDVEQEQNGIYFYDRSSKFDMKRINAIFSKTPTSDK
ncbi:glycoside hydrolase family 2 protein [Aestuariibaculum marinum]|uniref:Beta-glucuronidase n=1 Tax=Aestuariibaculum marinum TaxID=2683592 RepID=A0A8J6U5V6_9FLAO|nr:sugar-binding domain-containing protein [Aestuariibaculum marinum]MBD0825192.1 beta-glucuronidase [Aestuariibaculum marinum]